MREGFDHSAPRRIDTISTSHLDECPRSLRLGRRAQLNRRFERNPALLGSGDKAKLARMLALILGGVDGVKT